jgi:oxygen-independent coproporphyrinogen-3 oxidase
MHLYFHVPFCARRCSYCDFAIAVRREVPSEAYVEAVLAEWKWWLRHPAWQQSPAVETVYFGGGTPSRLDPSAIERILEQVSAERSITHRVEITLEANPEDVTADRAVRWRAAGVNRVSLGVQSFNPEVLRWMHRSHGSREITEAVSRVRSAGFADLSLDLIFGLPESLDRDWDADLAQALALGPDHLSLYGLTVEARTPLGRWTARGEVAPVDDERYAREFLVADAMLVSAGFEHYEVSNAARPGHRARHNSAYWSRAPYLGMGPSAHSGFGRQRQWNLREWAAYEQAVRRQGHAVDQVEQLGPEAIRLEELYLGLRTREGLASAAVPPELQGRWVGQGWAWVEGERIALTPEGWLRLDALVASLSAERRPVRPQVSPAFN